MPPRQPLEDALFSNSLDQALVNSLGLTNSPGISAMQKYQSHFTHQIANYSCFTWLNGSFIVDWLIHNIDVCCWAKNAWPISAQGMGGRQVRTDGDQLFDHYAAEFTFPDGTRRRQGRHQNHCHDFGDVIPRQRFGHSRRRPVLPRLYLGHKQSSRT